MSGVQVTTELPDSFEPTCMAHPDTYLNKVHDAHVVQTLLQ